MKKKIEKSCLNCVLTCKENICRGLSCVDNNFKYFEPKPESKVEHCKHIDLSLNKCSLKNKNMEDNPCKNCEYNLVKPSIKPTILNESKGIEIEIYHNRLTGSFELYRYKPNDLLKLIPKGSTRKAKLIFE